MNYSQTLHAAEEMINILSPVFTRLEIAGSLRRKVNKDFDEIDLIGIPDFSPPPRPRAEFGKPIPRVYETYLDQALAALEFKNSISLSQNGPRKKMFFSHLFGIRFDLYLVLPPATWGVLQLIRTGPEDFGKWIVTQKRKGGALPDGYRVQDGAVWKGEEKHKKPQDEPIGFDTETGFLFFLGLPWIKPEERAPVWNQWSPGHEKDDKKREELRRKLFTDK